MDFEIRKFKDNDKDEIIAMMTEFYSSPVVLTNGSPQIFRKDFDVCISNNPYLEGYVFENNNIILGYAMIAKSFSTEYAKQCFWLEDLFVKSEYRGNGIIPKFIKFLEKNNPETILKLEAENENQHAIHVYEKCGFKISEYIEMQKGI